MNGGIMMSKRKSKIGRNDLCHCGSGNKYKNCCLIDERKSSNSEDSGSSVFNKDKKMNIPSINKMRKKVKSAEAIKKIADANINNPHLPPVLRQLDWNEVSDSASDVIRFKDDIELPGYFNYHFSNLGWISYNSISVEIMKKTVHLADEGNLEEAENVLINYYGPKNVEIWINWLDWIDEFKPRMKLITTAFEDYKIMKYDSCILILIAVIDGIIFDNKETGNDGFFGKNNALKTTDDIVTHVTGLPALQELFSLHRGETNTEEITIPFRNGIVHGRDLDYSNVKVAAKLWGTLFALKEGIAAIKKEKSGKNKKNHSNLTDSFKLIEERNIRNKLMRNLVLRELKPNIDYPESGKSCEYGIGTPQRTLVEFFEYWSGSNPNFGAMGQMLCAFFIDERSFGAVAGDLSRNFFKGKQLVAFKLLDVIDENSDVTKILVELKIKMKDTVLTEDCIFKLIYEDDEGKSDVRGMPNRSWKIFDGLEHIKQL
jgi:hypothetical protein